MMERIYNVSLETENKEIKNINNLLFKIMLCLSSVITTLIGLQKTYNLNSVY